MVVFSNSQWYECVCLVEWLERLGDVSCKHFVFSFGQNGDLFAGSRIYLTYSHLNIVDMLVAECCTNENYWWEVGGNSKLPGYSSVTNTNI